MPSAPSHLVAPPLLIALLLLTAPAAAQTWLATPGAELEIQQEELALVSDRDEQRQHLTFRAVVRSSSELVGLLLPVPASSAEALRSVSHRTFDQLFAATAPPTTPGEASTTEIRPSLLCIDFTLPHREQVIAEIEPRLQPPSLPPTSTPPPDPETPQVLAPDQRAQVRAWIEARGLSAPTGLDAWLDALAAEGWSLVALAFPRRSSAAPFYTLPFALTFTGREVRLPLRRPTPDATPPGRQDLYLVHHRRLASVDPAQDGLLQTARLMPEVRGVFGDVVPADHLPLRPWLMHLRLDATSTTPTPTLTPSSDLVPRIPQAVATAPTRIIPVPLECFALTAFAAIAYWSWRKRRQ